MKLSRKLYLFLIVLATFIAGGCTVGVQDGMRVNNTGSTVKPTGYVTKAPVSGDMVRIQARNASTGGWVTLKSNISISASKSWTTKDGTDLFFWDAGNMTIPAAYWYSGTGGNYARLRAQWLSNGSWYNTLVSRKDWLTCFTENYNNEGNTLNYMLDNCFSHRGEAYIYTANYREGAASCPTPSATLAKTHEHYMMHQIPSCARTIISDHMREKIDENMILLHYEINHNSANADSKNQLGNDTSNTCGRQPGNNGMCELGGFFGGHERYIRRMERHVMVYDYPWMPVGKIPAWNGSTWIPTQFQNAEVSPNGSCNSWTCNGWRSDAITDSTPNASKPSQISPTNVCNYATVDDVAAASNGWHGNGHVLTGGHFGTFDSPANPLFFTWHNAINDVWLDYKACP
ncbi:tyrosinase family protein [Aliikangiella sp. G2MR2-5]|uniref:tyrosinase family protein n=1 Tax=Aliikangiella sp. G2MR2-5 TaxID=2788943 RepID=UPI0018ABC311|nr:tyrosinase family protein [Aliikangiella sp. G2MR2-5]